MDYQLVGDDMQAVIIQLGSGESIRAEAGSMMYMTQTIAMETKAGTSDDGGFMGALVSGAKRVMAGESFFMTTFTATHGPGNVAFSAPYPGKIIALDLGETGPILCQRDSFLCSDVDIDISIAFTKRLGAGFLGGEGFILQKLQGQGQAFIHAGGTVLPVDLQAGQELKLDTGCLVAMTNEVDYDIQMVSGVKNIFFGGEGMFLACLRGPGRVYLQTLPFSRIASRIIQAAGVHSSKGESRGVAGVVDVMDLFSGD